MLYTVIRDFLRSVCVVFLCLEIIHILFYVICVIYLCSQFVLVHCFLHDICEC